MRSPQQLRSTTGDFPTVLVAELDETVSAALCISLRDEGYNVLESDDWLTTVKFVKCHSRPIHALLIDTKDGCANIAETVKPYRPHMHILFIGQSTDESHPNVLHPDVALAKVRELIKPPTRQPNDFS